MSEKGQECGYKLLTELKKNETLINKKHSL